MDLEYYVSQFSSNDPGEDRFSSRYNPNYGSFYCVVDGHGGCFSCDLANTYILDYFIEELSKLSRPFNSSLVLVALRDTFQRCDDLILQESVRIRNLNLESRCPGRTGCCVALAAVLEERLYVAHVGDCRVVMCRSFEPPLTTEDELKPESPQKRTTTRETQDSSPSKRTRNMSSFHTLSSSSPLTRHPVQKLFINRDFHLESVLEKSNSRKTPQISPESPVPPENEKIGASSKEPSSQDDHKSKKKKKHKKNIFCEEDFDYPEFSGVFPNLQISLHCITKDHTCDDKQERTALKLLCPSDPKPMRSSSNDKKLFGKDAIKRVGGSLAITRALGDGYLKLAYLSEEPLKSHVPYITGLPYVSCRKLIFGVDTILLMASGLNGLWNYITIDEVALTLQQYITTRNSSPSISDSTPSISEILLDKCLRNAAVLAGTSFDSLLTMPSGPYKRNVIDDVTIVVIVLPPSLNI